jgi:hypothetical protein
MPERLPPQASEISTWEKAKNHVTEYAVQYGLLGAFVAGASLIEPNPPTSGPQVIPGTPATRSVEALPRSLLDVGPPLDTSEKTPQQIAKEKQPRPSGEVAPTKAGLYDPSEFAVGTMAMKIIFVQPDGSIDPVTAKDQWDPSEITRIENAIKEAAKWWEGQSKGNLKFVNIGSKVIRIGENPINRNRSDQSIWVGKALAKDGIPGTNHFEQAYINDQKLKQEAKADGATTVFVINGDGDLNGDAQFLGGGRGFAYINGPYLVIVSTKNNANGDPKSITIHELGHIFGALDQYLGAGVPCQQTGGYFRVPTRNSQYKQGSTLECTDFQSVMRGLEQLTLDPTTKAQVGLGDSTPNSGFNIDVAGQPVSNLRVTIINNGKAYRIEGTIGITPALSGDGTTRLEVNWPTNATVTDPISGRTAKFTPVDGSFDESVEEVRANIFSLSSNLVVAEEGHIGGVAKWTVKAPGPLNVNKVHIPMVQRSNQAPTQGPAYPAPKLNESEAKRKDRNANVSFTNHNRIKNRRG